MSELRPHLIKARDLIADPSRWSRFSMARDANGSQVLVHSKEACRWCILGAIEKVVPRHLVADVIDALLVKAAWLGHRSIDDLNDFGGHLKVLRLFDLTLNQMETASV